MHEILLISCSSYKFSKNDSFVIAGKSHMPLGILSIAAFLGKKGYSVRCMDQRLDDPEAYIKENFDKILFVGFSVMSADYPAAKELLCFAKESNPSLFCVIGGAHPSADPTEPVEYGFDVSVIGEGEIICSNIAEILRENCDKESIRKRLEHVESIAFRNDSNKIQVNPRKTFVEDLDSLPIIDRSLLAHKQYSETSISLVTSRGCPGKCLYCQSGPSLFGHKIRQRSAKNVIEEIGKLIAAGVSFITFLDDCLLWNERWVHEFCFLVKSENLKFSWICETRAQFIKESIMKDIIGAGCRGVNIGFESGSDDTLKFLKKGMNIEKYKICLDVLHRYGLQFHSYIIVGSPHETKEDIEKTVDFVKYAKPSQIMVSRLTPIYGCELYTYLAKNDLISNIDEQSFYQNQYPIKCNNLTPEDLDYYEVKMYKAMYIYGKKPEVLRGDFFLFDEPVFSILSANREYTYLIRVKNRTNYHWIAYSTNSSLPIEEVEKKLSRDAFCQQIEGELVQLYLSWYSIDGALVETIYAGHLVGNVLKGGYGTFVLQFVVPDGYDHLCYEYNLFLAEKGKILEAFGKRSFRRRVRVVSDGVHDAVSVGPAKHLGRYLTHIKRKFSTVRMPNSNSD